MCKTCTKCKKSYDNPIENFYKRPITSDGLTSICKYCSLKNKLRHEHVNKEGLLLCVKCNNYKSKENFDTNNKKWFRENTDSRCKDCKVAQYHKRRMSNRGNGSIDRMLMDRLRAAKDRARVKNYEINITIEYLKELWDKQKGRCALSNIKMTYTIFSGRVNSNVSIDRIDSLKGYTKGNIQLVCSAVNQMKNDLNYNELLYFCKNIIKNEKKNNN